ncbi:MAG: DUF4080 domain-containing protein [Candidatus Stygibacter australis]|nr:DUF4080 domain-containing protein [Candidatus Stygibacter australis]
MKKVILTTINARYTHTSLALYYLKAVLDEQNIFSEVCEYNINQPRLDIIEEILSKEPDIIAFSIYIWNVEQIKPIIADLKRLKEKITIIVGGPEVSYQPEIWQRKFPQLDYIVTGAGEGVITEILKDKEGRLKGIVPGKAVSLTEIPFPYKNMKVEGKESRYFYYETSRGCPFRCAYCLSSRSDQKLQYRDLDKVYEELEYFIKEGYRHIKLVDRTFNANSERARAIWTKICELYQEYPESNTGFHFEIHPQLLDKEDFEILAEVPEGRFRFEIGIQTLNEEVGKIIHRTMDWEIVSANILKLKNRCNIHLHLDLIAGLPGEDITSFAAGFDKVMKLGCEHLQLGFLKVLGGTEMESMVEEYGIIYQSTAPYQVMQTSKVNWQEMSQVRKVESIMDIYYNSGRYNSSMRFALVENKLSAWKLFWGLASYFQQQGLDLRMRDWEKCSKVYWEYLMQESPIENEELLDHLRIDWCQQSRSHYYPEFLRHKKLDEAREKAYKILLTYKNQERKLEAAQIRQAIFFQSVSERYHPEEILVFYGRPGRKEILKLELM